MATVDYHDLLSALKSMYLHLARMHLDQRLNTHKLKPANDSVDLSDTLFQQIDRLASNRNDTATSTSTAPRVGAAADGATGTPASSRRGKSSAEAIVNNGLKDHLQNQRHSNTNDLLIAARMEKATWHHVHLALFHARNGREDTAKLHANIALQAMKEVHKYLDDEEYAQFSDSVKQKITSEI